MRTWVPPSGRSQGEEHDGVEPQGVPGVGELFERIDDENLAVDHAIRALHGVEAELELSPGSELEVIFDKPLRDERPSASARQSFSGGCGDALSITTVRVPSLDWSSLLHCSWIHPFQKCFEPVEPVAPERAVVTQPVHHRRQGIGLRAIVCFASLAAMPYQLCPLQHRQVLGDSRLGDARIASQRVDGLFALPGQLLEDGPARRIGEGTEDVIGIGRLHTENHNRMVTLEDGLSGDLIFAMPLMGPLWRL